MLDMNSAFQVLGSKAVPSLIAYFSFFGIGCAVSSVLSFSHVCSRSHPVIKSEMNLRSFVAALSSWAGVAVVAAFALLIMLLLWLLTLEKPMLSRNPRP